MMALLPSCKKEHYNVGNVSGVNAEGELLLPIASSSLTMMDMMTRFKMDSIIDCSESGDLSYNIHFEDNDVVNAHGLLRFNDMSHHQHFAFPNPFVAVQPPFADTMIAFEKTFVFESDRVSVLEAVMKMGRFDFQIESNLGNLRRVVLRSPDIKDAMGNDFVLDTEMHGYSFGFDLEGLRYLTDEANSLTFSYELYFRFAPTTEPELFVDVIIQGRDITMHSMRGFLAAYSSRNLIDTVFSLFPGNLTGVMGMEGLRLRISERNTFPLVARLAVDTALVSGEGIEPYSIFDPMPLVVELPSQTVFTEVLDQSLNGKLNSSGGNVYISSEYVVNPMGMAEMVTVVDTCSVDLKIDLNIPFAFEVDDVRYVDTIEMNLSELEMPDLIEKITLELTFNSTLPLNLNGQFYMYDSESGTVTDALLSDTRLIQASFDDQPTTTTVSIDIAEEKIENMLHSDRIIMAYGIDTEAHNVTLNANQKLELFAKARVKYNGIIEY
jgi:hypothetical protein